MKHPQKAFHFTSYPRRGRKQMKMVIGKVGVGQTQERGSRAPVPEHPCQGRGGGGHRFHRAWGGVVKRRPDSCWGARPALAGPPPSRACCTLARDGRTDGRTDGGGSEFSVLPPHHHPDLLSLCHERRTFLSATWGRTTPKVKAERISFQRGQPGGSSSFMAVGSAQAFGVNSPFHTDNWGS